MKNINFTIAFRFFKKDRLFTIINLLGLSIGLACVYFITLYVTDETSYDSFIGEDVYRVALNRELPNESHDFAISPAPLCVTFKHEFPAVEQASRVLYTPEINFKVENEEKDISFREEKIYFADSSFVELLSIPVINGVEEPLSQPYSAVFTDKFAIKYFNTTDVVGRKILINDTVEYNITAVVEDVSIRSHLEFDMLLSWNSFPNVDNPGFDWVTYNAYNYIKLAETATPESFEGQLGTIVTNYIAPQIERILNRPYADYENAGNRHNFYVQKAKDIHLHSRLTHEMKPNGDFQYIILFSVIGLFILLVAAINFTNLSTARSIKRAKEVGVRKTLGSTKKSLFVQFFIESAVMCLMAGLLAGVFFVLFLPQFNQLASKDLSFDQINWLVQIPLFFLVIVVLSLMSGAYPSLFISSFNVVKILKGQVTQGKNKNILRNTLVITQFSLSIFLIIGTIVINRQVDFLINKNLGYDKEHILTIDDANLLSTSFVPFKNQVEQIPGVQSVSSSLQVPGRGIYALTFEVVGESSTERYRAISMTGDREFMSTYEFEIVEGRGYEPLRNDSLSVILNEAAVKSLGWDNPIGKKLLPATFQSEVEVVGVVKDFHFTSLHEEIGPLLIFSYDLNNFISFNNIYPPILNLRIDNSADVQQVIASVSNLWDELVQEETMNYTFLDQEYEDKYRTEVKFGDIFMVFASMAIFIALIGLIGLSSFFAIQKTREIGIRKVLGAPFKNLVFIMSKDFIKMLLIANLVAWPLAYYALSRWLQNYPYDIAISVDIFLIAGGSSLALVLLATGYQSVKSAMLNPVKSIRID
ncbi:MAG: ABC transporter permease [Fulvivirga sp.]|uniref:ABC transporter permease n=1 Tax=Fulvivirga sp. TaxID=1931237 RepID=UPI0032EB2A2E